MTALLEEHVYLIAVASGARLAGGDTSGPTAEVERNTGDLQTEVGVALGDSSATAFGAAWRKQSQAFMAYASAKAATSPAGVDQAKADLDADRATLASVFDAGTSGNFGTAAATVQLKAHNDAIRSAIDSQAAKKPNQFAQVKRAADKMPDFADVLVAAFVKAKPAVFEGTNGGGRALLLSTLTAALQAHVYLTGFVTGAALRGGDVTDAAAALDANSVDLANLIGSIYGDAANQQFLVQWRKHTGLFVDYAKAKAANDPSGTEAANANLVGSRGELGAFIESATKARLTRSAVAESLAPYVRSLEAAIDAQSSNSHDQVSGIADAAKRTHDVAAELTDALAKQFPDRFPSA
jgi:hypothetical protein